MPGDEVHEEAEPSVPREASDADRGSAGPRHAAPRKPLLNRLHVPAGKAIAIAAMPSAVLMGMGLTPQFASAKPLPKNPFKGDSCVSQPDKDEAAEEKAAEKAAEEKAKQKAKEQAAKEKEREDASESDSDSAKPEPEPGPEPPSGDDGGSGGNSGGGSGGSEDPEPSPSPSEPGGDDDGGLLGGVGDTLGEVLSTGENAPSDSGSDSSSDSGSGSDSGSDAAKSVEDTVGEAGDDLKDTTGKLGESLADVDEAVRDKTPAPSGDKAGKDATEKDTTGKDGFPCVEEKKSAGKDEQTPNTLPNEPWTLKATSLGLHSLDYKGVRNVRTQDGKSKQVLKFTASSVDIVDLHQIVQGPNGTTYHVRSTKGSTSTIRGGTVTMYTERLKGDLFGLIPIVFDPEHPPPLNVPEAYFTDVEVSQAGQFGGNLTVPGLHQTID